MDTASTAKGKALDRRERLAAALRDNLKKRKGKQQPAASPGGGEAPAAGSGDGTSRAGD